MDMSLPVRSLSPVWQGEQLPEPVKCSVTYFARGLGSAIGVTTGMVVSGMVPVRVDTIVGGLVTGSVLRVVVTLDEIIVVIEVCTVAVTVNGNPVVVVT